MFCEGVGVEVWTSWAARAGVAIKGLAEESTSMAVLMNLLAAVAPAPDIRERKTEDLHGLAYNWQAML